MQKCRHIFCPKGNVKSLAKCLSYQTKDLLLPEQRSCHSRTHIFLSLTKHTETWNEKINWNLVNKPLDLALVLRDKVIDNFKKRENLDDGNIPEIEKYFELVSDEILSLKKK